MSGPTNACTYVAGGLAVPSDSVLVATAYFDGDPDYVIYNPGTRQTAIWHFNNNVCAGSAWGPTLPVGWSLVAPSATVDVNPDVVFATTIAALKRIPK